MPTPFELEAKRLAQREAIANGLLQQGFAPPAQGQMVSGHYVSPGILGALTPLLSAFAGKRVQADVDTKMADLMTRQTQSRGAELARLQALPAEQRIAEALVSQDPQIQEWGKLVAARTPGLKEAIGITGVDPAAAVEAVQTGDIGRVKAAPPKPIEVNGQLVDPTTFAAVGDYRTTGGETIKIGEDLYQKMSDGTLKKLDNAPRTTVNVQTPDMIRALTERENSQALIKDLSGLPGFAGQYNRGMATLAEAEAALNAGTLQGALAPGAELASEVGASVGIKRPAAVLNTQRFQGAILPTILDEVQKLRPASDIDVKFIRENIGNASRDPTIMKEILNRYRNVLESTREQYEAKRAQLGTVLQRDVPEYPPITPQAQKPATAPGELTIDQLSSAQKEQLRKMLGGG